MADLIRRVRLLIADPGGPAEIFHDQEIQDALDRHRLAVVQRPLRYEVTYSSTAVSYLEFFAGQTDWESDATIYGATFAAVVPTTSDYLAGQFTFSTSQTPPLYITGKTFDVYRTAADLLELWAAKEPFSVVAGLQGAIVTRGKAEGRFALAKHYRRRQRPKLIALERCDST